MKGLKDLLGFGLGKPSNGYEDPSDPKTWYNKGVALMAEGSFEEAIDCFGRAVELDPMNVKAWNNKGICLLSLSRYEDAIKCIEEAIKIDPNHAFYWYNKGICHGPPRSVG